MAKILLILFVVSIILLTLLMEGCTIKKQMVLVQEDICVKRKLIANVWAYRLLPYTIQGKVVELMKIAQNRNTYRGTEPSGYQGDAVSRTLGSVLREEVRDRAPVNASLRVYYLDPETTYAVRYLGDLHVLNGVGVMVLPDDPRQSIVEITWPKDFISPIKSGDEHRLWLFGEEWKTWCTMNVHGLVP